MVDTGASEAVKVKALYAISCKQNFLLVSPHVFYFSTVGLTLNTPNFRHCEELPRGLGRLFKAGWVFSSAQSHAE